MVPQPVFITQITGRSQLVEMPGLVIQSESLGKILAVQEI